MFILSMAKNPFEFMYENIGKVSTKILNRKKTHGV